MGFKYYDYECEHGHVFEYMSGGDDDHPTECSFIYHDKVNLEGGTSWFCPSKTFARLVSSPFVSGLPGKNDPGYNDAYKKQLRARNHEYYLRQGRDEGNDRAREQMKKQTGPAD